MVATLAGLVGGGCSDALSGAGYLPEGYQIVHQGGAVFVMSDAEKRIHDALEQKTSAQFQNTPFGAAMAYFSKKHGIPIVLDERRLVDIGVDATTPIMVNLSGITLRSALRLILEPLDANYVIRDEVLVITAADPEENLFVRVYYVADLVSFEHPLFGSAYGPDYDSLIDVIIKTTEPESWDVVGGPGSIEEFAQRSCLVITQTEEVHERVVELLTQLRAFPVSRVYETRPSWSPTPAKGQVTGIQGGLLGIPAMD